MHETWFGIPMPDDVGGLNGIQPEPCSFSWKKHTSMFNGICVLDSNICMQLYLDMRTGLQIIK